MVIPEDPEPETRDFEVHPDNWAAFQLFQSMETNWRIVAGLGGAIYQGIDYSALTAVIRLRHRKRKKQSTIFDSVQLIELGALEVLNSGIEKDPDNTNHPG